jgi:hypothetical protein
MVAREKGNGVMGPFSFAIGFDNRERKSPPCARWHTVAQPMRNLAMVFVILVMEIKKAAGSSSTLDSLIVLSSKNIPHFRWYI